MLEGLRKVFGLDYETRSRRECEKYVSRLPQASARIVIGSPQYKPERFHCEVLVPTSALLAWLKDHYSRSSVSFHAQALMSWLRSADPDNPKPTYIGAELFRAIEGYEGRLIDAGVATITCASCQDTHNTVFREQRDVKTKGNWHSGTTIWKCPVGHKIYEQDFRYHVLR